MCRVYRSLVSCLLDAAGAWLCPILLNMVDQDSSVLSGSLDALLGDGGGREGGVLVFEAGLLLLTAFLTEGDSFGFSTGVLTSGLADLAHATGFFGLDVPGIPTNQKHQHQNKQPMGHGVCGLIGNNPAGWVSSSSDSASFAVKASSNCLITTLWWRASELRLSSILIFRTSVVQLIAVVEDSQFKTKSKNKIYIYIYIQARGNLGGRQPP